MTIWTQLAKYATLETARLILRPFRFADRQDFFSIVSSPTNAVYIYPVQSELVEAESLLVTAFMRQPLGIWAIEEKESHRMIGAIRFENIDEWQGRAEMGYFLQEAFWGQGLMTEVVEAVVTVAFGPCQMTELVIVTHAGNHASQRVAEKAGFTRSSRYKGSDRYTHQTGWYQSYRYRKQDYQRKEKI